LGQWQNPVFVSFTVAGQWRNYTALPGTEILNNKYYIEKNRSELNMICIDKQVIFSSFLQRISERLEIHYQEGMINLGLCNSYRISASKF